MFKLFICEYCGIFTCSFFYALNVAFELRFLRKGQIFNCLYMAPVSGVSQEHLIVELPNRSAELFKDNLMNFQKSPEVLFVPSTFPLSPGFFFKAQKRSF